MGWFDKVRYIFSENNSVADSGKESVHSIEVKQGVILIMYSAGYKKLITLPKSFDLDKHLELYPPVKCGFPADKRFNKQKAHCWLGLITSIHARINDNIIETGYTRINMSIIRNGYVKNGNQRKGQGSIKDIKLYVDYLIATGVILCDKQYIPGQKSRGYRWSDKYFKDKFEVREVDCNYADDVEEYESKSLDLKEYPYLFHWFQQGKLIIDADAAREYAFTVKEKKFNTKKWDINRDATAWNGKKSFKNPQNQYLAAVENIGKLQFQKYEAHIDDNIHRLHSVLTNLQKDLRNFITYNGQQLVGIDLKNCQPYLVCLILNPEFWEKDSKLPVNLYNLPANIVENLCNPPELVMEVKEFLSATPREKFEPYIELAASGLVYEGFADIANAEIKDADKKLERDDAKTMMFHLLFSKNGSKHQDKVINAMKKKFNEELYPEVAQLFQIIKQEYKGLKDKDGKKVDKQHNRLSCLLQAIESQIILHRCCKRVWIETGGDMPIFTIHDSIVTTLGNKGYVMGVMDAILTECIGIAPKLDDKDVWDRAKLTDKIAN